MCHRENMFKVKNKNIICKFYLNIIYCEIYHNINLITRILYASILIEVQGNQDCLYLEV